MLVVQETKPEFRFFRDKLHEKKSGFDWKTLPIASQEINLFWFFRKNTLVVVEVGFLFQRMFKYLLHIIESFEQVHMSETVYAN